MPNTFFEELKKLLEKLPGIGPRQASRFIWAFLDFDKKDREKLAGLINELDKHLARCGECFRAAPSEASAKEGFLCSFCDPHSKRDHLEIMVLERDSDLLNMEKAGVYKGLYHILSGMINPLDENNITRQRIKALYDKLSLGQSPKLSLGQKEIILALSSTKLGEFTASYIEKILEPLKESKKLKITRLGRGISTGTELEYADETTLRQALDNRK